MALSSPKYLLNFLLNLYSTIARQIFKFYVQIIGFWVNKKLFYTFLLIPPGKTLQKNYIKTLCPYHHPLPPGLREITNPAGQLFFFKYTPQQKTMIGNYVTENYETMMGEETIIWSRHFLEIFSCRYLLTWNVNLYTRYTSTQVWTK